MARGQIQFIRQIRLLLGPPHADAKSRLKWILAVFACFLLLLFVVGGPYGLFSLFKLKREQRALRTEIRTLTAEGDSLKALIERLKNDPAETERIAREHYGMSRKGEKVYRFEAPPGDKKEQPHR